MCFDFLSGVEVGFDGSGVGFIDFFERVTTKTESEVARKFEGPIGSDK